MPWSLNLISILKWITRQYLKVGTFLQWTHAHTHAHTEAGRHRHIHRPCLQHDVKPTVQGTGWWQYSILSTSRRPKILEMGNLQFTSKRITSHFEISWQQKQIFKFILLQNIETFSAYYSQKHVYIFAWIHPKIGKIASHLGTYDGNKSNRFVY